MQLTICNSFRADHRVLPMNLIDSSVDGKIKIGDIISYKYSNLTLKNYPINPIIFRIRSDLTWDDVMMNQGTKIRSIDGKIIFSSSVTMLISIIQILEKGHYRNLPMMISLLKVGFLTVIGRYKDQPT
jgi:hypothetical protein